MKIRKVNQRGSPIAHVITHAVGDAAPNRTFAARCTMEVKGEKVYFKWRIFAQKEKTG